MFSTILKLPRLKWPARPNRTTSSAAVGSIYWWYDATKHSRRKGEDTKMDWQLESLGRSLDPLLITGKADGHPLRIRINLDELCLHAVETALAREDSACSIANNTVVCTIDRPTRKGRA